MLLVGFLGNSISSYYVSRDSVRKTITESSLPLTSDNLYSVIQRDLLKPIFISSMMANDAFLRSWAVEGEPEVESVQRYLHEIRREFGTVTSFFVSERTRNYYHPDGILKEVREDDPRDEWYFRVREMEEPFEINVDPDKANEDTMTIFINYRVYDFDGEHIGAAGTGLTVSRVNTLIEEYEEKFGRDIFFANPDGTIVLTGKNGRGPAYRSLQEIPGLSKHVAGILAESEEDVMYERNGDRYFLNSRFVPELNWFLIVEQTEDVLLAPLRETLFLNICLALLITGIVAAVCGSAIHRHQKKLQFRNEELTRMNREVELQREELARTARELTLANKSLSMLDREKDDFLGIVAHDLRNPLNGVLGFCEEIRLNLPEEDGESRAFLKEIRNCGREMLGLVDDILNVSAIEGFNGDLDLQPVNWNRLAQDVEERFRGEANRKKMSLELTLDDAADFEVLTRDKWMAICLNNLVSNALKFGPAGSIVTIETRKGTNRVELSVRDQGPGLKPEEVERVFEKFVKLSAVPTGTEASSGLGLYIVKKMCQRLGATVRVESEFGGGARFVIEHPIYDEANPSPLVSGSPEITSGPVGVEPGFGRALPD